MTEAKAVTLMQEGENRLEKFAPFTSGEEKREKARDKFIQAATIYKATDNWAGAAAAFKRSADMSEKSKNEIDVIDDLTNCGNAQRKAGDLKQATEILTRVVDMLDKNGKYAAASRVCIGLGDDGGDAADAWYQKAIGYLRNDGMKVSSNEIVVKMINRSVERGHYDYARQEYDKMAKEYLDEALTRCNARKYFFMALLCRIATITPTNLVEGIEALQQEFAEAQDMDPQFNGYTREHMLIAAVIDALENEDPDAFTDAVMDYDNICPLDASKEKMLLRGKHAIRRSSPTDDNRHRDMDAMADDEDAR
jgi:alpha-soluble NSF attachment protein